jgi:probable blue pigment (indigoidine) exporter
MTTELLPPARPLLAGAIRALPAGLLLLALVTFRYGRLALPRGSWWWRAAVLGGLNIGLFFALFFIAAYRLPGGVAAVLGAVGPFLVAGLAYPLLGERTARKVMIAAAFGVAGVALLVLRSTASLDPIGLAAAAVGVITVSLATVLGRRWGVPVGPSPMAGVLILTAWQLVSGGLLLLPAALVLEGPPPVLDSSALLGFGYLALVGTALAHVLWFQGVIGLAPTRVTMLALLSPVVATIMGWIVLGQALSGWQLGGAALVLGAVVLGVSRPSAAESEINTVRPAPARRSRWIGSPTGVYSVASSPGHRGR